MARPDVLLASCQEVLESDSVGKNGLSMVSGAEDALLIEQLAKLGLSSEFRAWDDPGAEWSARMCVIRSTWNYPSNCSGFRRWLANLAARMPVWNPPDMILWNMHKGYLRQLGSTGIHVVPSVVCKADRPVCYEELTHRLGSRTVVAKPAYSAGGFGTLLCDIGRELDRQKLRATFRTGDFLVQPFVESVRLTGERSIVLLGGKVSHVVEKMPAKDDYRVQVHFGGQFQLAEVTQADTDIAKRCLSALSTVPLYARVDTVQVDGRHHVLELELIEPSLFFGVAPAGARILAEAIAERIDT